MPTEIQFIMQYTLVLKIVKVTLYYYIIIYNILRIKWNDNQSPGEKN